MMAFLWKLTGPGQQIFDVSIVLPKHFVGMLLHNGQNVPDIEVRPEAVRFCGFYQAIDSCTGLGSVDRINNDPVLPITNFRMLRSASYADIRISL